MDIYHSWFNLKPGVKDVELVEQAKRYFEHLKAEGLLVGYRIMRRKLGLGAAGLPEFHVMLEFEGLAQLDKLFALVASRTEPIESLHHGVNARVTDATFALYRDFPDEVRVVGQELF